jgi:hypothetical protein
MALPFVEDVETKARDFVYTVVGLGVLTQMLVKMQVDKRLARLRGNGTKG